MTVGPAAREQLQADLGHPEPRPQRPQRGPAPSSRRARRPGPGRGATRGMPWARGARDWLVLGHGSPPRCGQRPPTSAEPVDAAPRGPRLAAPPGPGPAPGGRRRSPCPPGPRWRRPAAARPRPLRWRCRRPRRWGGRRSAARTSNTARTATGWMAGPDSPPPPWPSTGRPVVRVEHQPEHGVDERHRLGSALARPRPRSPASSGVFGLSLAQRGPPAARGGLHGRPGGLGRVGEHVAPILQVRAGEVHLDRDHLGGRARPAGRRPPGTPRPTGPRCWPPPGRPVAQQRRQVVAAARPPRRVPGARRR